MYKLINSLECKLSKFAPYQVIIFGFVTYILTGLLFISLPCAQKIHVSFVDNLFNIVSALSTTGLTTGNISQLYTPFGKLVLLTLIQLGAIGYMTITSFFILSSGQQFIQLQNKNSQRRIHTSGKLQYKRIYKKYYNLHICYRANRNHIFKY